MKGLFKVGDRVEYVGRQYEGRFNKLPNKLGVIRKVRDGSYSVEFHKDFDGHNCNGMCPNENGYFINEQDLRLDTLKIGDMVVFTGSCGGANEGDEAIIVNIRPHSRDKYVVHVPKFDNGSYGYTVTGEDGKNYRGYDVNEEEIRMKREEKKVDLHSRGGHVTFKRNDMTIVVKTPHGKDYLNCEDYSKVEVNIHRNDHILLDATFRIDNETREEDIKFLKELLEGYAIEITTSPTFGEILDDIKDNEVPAEVLEFLKDKGVL